MQTAPNLTAGQLEILKMMARPMSEADLAAIKKLIVRYFAEKLTARADEIWDKNGWTEADEPQLLQIHRRTPY